MNEFNEDQFILPMARNEKIVVTPIMTEVTNRSLSVHSLNPLILWYGVGRIGKTTAGLYVVNWLNTLFDANKPDSYRAVHYQVGGLKRGSGNGWKQGIRSIFQGASGFQMDEGFYIRNPPEVLARHTVHTLRRLQIQLVIVDEAGLLSAEAILAITLVRDIAEAEGWKLSIILVGKGDLPRLVSDIEHVHKRVLEWCHFKEYDLDETWAFLREWHPHFAKLDGSKTEDRKLVEMVHQVSSGLLGPMVEILHKLDYRLNNFGGTVDARFINGVHELTKTQMMEMLKQSGKSYRPYQTVVRAANSQHEAKPKDPVGKQSSKRNKPGRR